MFPSLVHISLFQFPKGLIHTRCLAQIQMSWKSGIWNQELQTSISVSIFLECNPDSFDWNFRIVRHFFSSSSFFSLMAPHSPPYLCLSFLSVPQGEVAVRKSHTDDVTTDIRGGCTEHMTWGLNLFGTNKQTKQKTPRLR